MEFKEKWEQTGIKVPVIPGIMPIQSYMGFNKMISLCQIEVPEYITEGTEKHKDDDAKLKKLGVEIWVEMCEELIKKGVKFLHLYTVNLEKSTVDVIKNLGIMWKGKSLPWKKRSFKDREEESVRPIFWANKPKSYIAKTNQWDKYPNGRWGVSRLPTFGDMGDYPSMS